MAASSHSRSGVSTASVVTVNLLTVGLAIVPMHVTLIVAMAINSPSTLVLVLFMALKTLADVVIDTIEHAAWPQTQTT